MSSVLLSPKEVCSRLKIKMPTLQKWRVDGLGPKFIKLEGGRNAAVRYHESDLEDYIASRLRRDSSSE